NGYTNIKDNGGSENNLEVVIIDIKTGNASLSRFQQAIGKAIDAGRVRFEVVRPETETPEKQHPHNQNKSSQQYISTKTYSTKNIRETYSRAYKYWNRNEDERLRKLYKQGVTINHLATEFQRKPGAICSRLKKLGLLR
ncbi:Holliday junction resolvase-like protein, partial [Calothrix rhizosoleniae]|uniref:Holliday junction resolvase-like protein n=1 Tax=Calothrix rhizosoleniae TaxID=888997 RepID=UPI00190EBD02